MSWESPASAAIGVSKCCNVRGPVILHLRIPYELNYLLTSRHIGLNTTVKATLMPMIFEPHLWSGWEVRWDAATAVTAGSMVKQPAGGKQSHRTFEPQHTWQCEEHGSYPMSFSYIKKHCRHDMISLKCRIIHWLGPLSAPDVRNTPVGCAYVGRSYS